MLAVLVAPPPAMAREAGRVNRGGHFNVVFFGPENSVSAHLISLVLEEAYRKIGADLLYWPDGRLGAVLYPRKEFFDITRSPAWVGAIYDGKIKMPAGGVTERTGALERVIFHEYTHALVYSLSSGRAPTWLNEGLAQYEEGRTRPGLRARVKGLLDKGATPLDQLEGSFLGMDPVSAARAYDISLSVTSFIIDEYGFSAVKKILAGLGKGLEIDTALRSAIFLSYEDLERAWRASVMR